LNLNNKKEVKLLSNDLREFAKRRNIQKLINDKTGKIIYINEKAK